ncbi:hypothetical protein Q3G72_033093 [Acer saccharum]|nr:hypothetical protein Q3G72_033093 [Acer saccharum]
MAKDHHQPHSFTKKLLPWTLYTILPIAIFRCYFYPPQFPHSSTDELSLNTPIIIPSSSSSAPPFSSSSLSQEGEIRADEPPCDYTNGNWVQDKIGPLYNGTTCGTIKEAPNLVYRNGEDNKFRKWNFASHNVNISVYWSPFLVDGVEKSNTGPNYNKLYLDRIDEKWGADLDHIDMIVLSVGHWFLHPAVYFDGDSVLGCHFCEGLNHTEIGFYDVLRKALKTTLKTITERRGSSVNVLDVIVTTFSPAHFEGEWDKAGACSKTKPYKEGEKVLEGMDAEMRNLEVEEVDLAKENAKQFKGMRLEALDVTKLSLMRPDGHPGPYMHPNPFAGGIKERVQNDCVHWCLPGPVDTWNQILLAIIKRWEGQSRKGE